MRDPPPHPSTTDFLHSEMANNGEQRRDCGAPEIAVVIPTYRRETRLAFALEALAEQSLSRDRFEVIVVRAPGEGPTSEQEFELNVRFVGAPGKGPAAQRNHGWRSAAAPLVAFTDDDCRPAPDWLERMLAAGEGAGIFLQGRTLPDPDERHLLHGRARSMQVVELSDWLPTCNIAYPRSVLESVGGFDERFAHAWGEDTDLGLRALEGGASVRYVEDAVVWHAVHARTLCAAVSEATRRDAIPAVISRHPRQRRHLYRGVFVRRSHANLFLALVGLAAIRRSRLLALAAALPYLRQNVARKQRPLRALPRVAARVAYHLPPRLLVDLVEMLATAQAAVRHRVFVL